MEIRISKISRRCFGCNRPFEHEEEVCSVVRYGENGFVREDYAREHWSSEKAENAFSVWVTRYHDPKVAEQEPPEHYSPLRKLFYDAVESNDRSELAKAYLAAQLLRRQKVFRLIKQADSSEDEMRLELFEDRLGNRLIEVRDPQLAYAELEAGRIALIQCLAELEHPREESQKEAPGHVKSVETS
jgi:hypothetical protein